MRWLKPKSRNTTPRVAIILHVHYDDIALDIVQRISRIEFPHQLFVTSVDCAYSPALGRALYSLPRDPYFIPSENIGRDVKPFLDALYHPRVAGQFDVVCKIHTKKGVTEFADVWRNIFLNTLLNPNTFAEVCEAFVRDPELSIVGPRDMYKSARQFMFANATNIEAISWDRFGKPPPADWGYFAGTMFFSRPDLYSSLSRYGHASNAFEPEPIGNDGATPHAMERIFGMVPLLKGGRVGLIDLETKSLSTHSAPGPVNTSIMKHTWQSARDRGLA